MGYNGLTTYDCQYIKIGNFGDIATFSIRSEKMIGVGEGGVVVTNHSGLYEAVMRLASRAAPFRTKHSPYWAKYFYDGEGYNYRLPHILGAIARAQIERFEKEIVRAKEIEAKLIIVVEDTLANAMRFKFLPYISKKIKVTPEYIFHNVRYLIQKYPHIQFLFVKGRKESKRVIKKIVFSGCSHEKIDLQLAYDTKIL